MLRLILPPVEPLFRLEVNMSEHGIQRGAAVRIAAYIYSRTIFVADVLVDPAVGVTITIKDPDEVDVVTDAPMLQEVVPVVGEYYYDWQTTSGMDEGIYSYEIIAEDTTYDGFEIGTFKLI